MKRENKKKRKNQKGFTLVEMIVVIAIIGVLATMMVPSLLGFVDKAHISNNNATAAGIGRGVQALLIEDYGKGFKHEGMYTGVYAGTPSALKITAESRPTPGGKGGNADAFATRINDLITSDTEFPEKCKIIITIDDNEKLVSVTYTKDGASNMGTYEP